MTLTTRLLLFYFGSLAVVLVGFSATIYGLVKVHLQQQSDERLEAALNTLSAAVEISESYVEWEPNERIVRFSAGTEQNSLAWLVTSGQDQLVAHSDRPNSDDLLEEASSRFRGPTPDVKRLYWNGERWQAAQRWITPNNGTPNVTIPHHAPPATPLATDSAATGTKESHDNMYPALIITVAIPLEPTRTTLRWLLCVLTGVSAGVLAFTLVVGRAVIRWALRPVQRMAADARDVNPIESDRRIATPTSDDELTDLGIAFNGLLDRLHVSLERQRRFTGDASHQLRTPLAAILGQIEIALRRDRSGVEYRQTLTNAQSRAGQLLQIVESLLYLTRSDAEGFAPRQEPIELSEWMPRYLDSWIDHPRFQDFQFVGFDESCPVLGHPVLLGEVLTILLDNACRYSSPGQSIALTRTDTTDAVQLTVSDHGSGITHDDMPHLFTPFFRTSDALRVNKNGVGLGLSIAKRLTEALGGTLSVTSEVGVGSAFIIRLQRVLPESVARISP